MIVQWSIWHELLYKDRCPACKSFNLQVIEWKNMTLSHFIYSRELPIHWRMPSDISTWYGFWAQDSRTAALVCKNEIHHFFISNDMTICRSHRETSENRQHSQEFMGVRYRIINWFQEKWWMKGVEKENVPRKDEFFTKNRYRSCL